MKGKDNEITLELVVKTIFELKRLPEYEKKNLLDLVPTAYDFLDFCQEEMADGKARRARIEETNRLLNTEPAKFSKVVQEVTGGKGSYYDKVFKEFLQAVYRGETSDFLENRQIPSGFVPEMKKKFQTWNTAKRKLRLTKNALIGRHPEKKDLIERVRSFLELRSLDL
jgi:hypothetical protein